MEFEEKMNKTIEKIDIEIEIKKKVKQYVEAQKRYHGDSALSKRLEGEIDSLEIKLKQLENEIK